MTTQVSMWGLFWKGTNTLACPALYRSKGACSNAVYFRSDACKQPGDDYREAQHRWKKLKPDLKYELLGMECRVAFSLECSEAKP